MKTVKEGKAEIYVPSESLTKKSETFYNPGMEYQRNVTISALRVFNKKRVLDPLAATGVRGIRILKEVEGAEEVVFNDVNPRAVRLIEKNVKHNKLRKSDFDIYQKDANALFIEKGKFDFVDVDPFGSPAKFLKNVGYALRKDSLLGVTATDTGALSGKFANACFRRYGVMVDRTDFPKELGIRVLITSTLLNLASHNMTFHPLYSHANHYFRIIGKISYGSGSKLKEVRMISYCPKCHAREIGVIEKCRNCRGKVKNIGPLWTGGILDRDFSKKLMSAFSFGDSKEIAVASEEVDHPFYYDLHRIAKAKKKSSPGMDKVMKGLRSRGFEASRTHLCATGIKTSAGVKDILKHF